MPFLIFSPTSYLHIALILAGIREGDEVICPALTFVATANAVSYCRAYPLLADSEKYSLGLHPEKLEEWLQHNTKTGSDGFTYNVHNNRRISICVPMHTFGHAVRMDELMQVCSKYNITVVEDAAESLGTFYKGKHTGTFGKLGILSYNGNKTITTGGGGMILTSDEKLAQRAKHTTTTAIVPNNWEFKQEISRHNQIKTNVKTTNRIEKRE